jgi:serine/threonine protein kinase
MAYVEVSGGAVDRIRPIAPICDGRNGQIFVGFDDVLRRRVVVKRLAVQSFASADARRHLLAEARILSRIDHPNVLRIHDYNEQDGHDVFVIELAEGQLLPAVLAAGLDFAMKVQIATAVASTLTVAHRNGVVHGALSPDSLMISDKGEIKIVDFDSMRTSLDGSRGDPQWRSPEELNGAEPSRESDLYRFGLLLEELFGAGDRDVRALIAALLHEAPTDRLTAADALERLRRIASRPARRLRIAAAAVLVPIVALGSTKYTLDLKRERAAALAAQAEAEAGRAAANELVVFMIEDLRPKLYSVGKLEIMDATTEKALAYFASIDPREISAAEAAVNIHALAQFSEAQVLRDEVGPAEETARKALALANAALRKHPSDVELLFARATAHAGYAGALSRKGDLPQAFVHANAYAAGCADLVRRKPADIRILRSHAVAFGILGSLYTLVGDTEASFRNNEISETSLRRLFQREKSEHSRAELFTAGRHNGATLIRLGRFREARQRLESNRAEVESALRQEPYHKDLLEIRAGYDDQLTAVALATGDLDAARRYADVQLAASEQLVAFDPARFRWTRLLVMAHRSAGTIARLSGDLGEARRHHTASIAAASAFLARGSTLPTLPRENAHSRIELARSLLAAGRTRDALLHAGGAAEALRGMPADPSAQALLADALLVRGEALAAEHGRDEAGRSWSDALAVAESLAIRPPDPRTIDTHARILLRLGRLERATPLVEQLAALGYRNREFEALCREKGAI